MAETTRPRLRSFAARLHWRTSPAPRKPMKAASAFGFPASSGAWRRLLSSRAGHSRRTIIIPAYPPEPTWRGRARSRSVAYPANLSATLDARADLGWALPIYTFATPVLGGQASVGVLGMYGRVSTSLAETLSGSLATCFRSHAPTPSATRWGASETSSR